MKKIKIGTPNSDLSLWQARYVQQQLANIGTLAEVVVFQNQPLGQENKTGGVFFHHQITEALLRGEVDLAIYDLAKIPTSQPEGLVLAGLSQRDDPAERLLIRPESLADGSLFSLKENAVVGASSAIRKAQLLAFRPDLAIVTVEGNVSAHKEQLRRGKLDALLLGGADVVRLGLDLTDLKVVTFSPKEFVPSPAQGVTAYQCCEADLETRRLVKQIHQPLVAAVTNVERAILKGVGDDLPVGAYCEMDANGNYHVWVAYAPAPNASVKRARLSSSTNHLLAERVLELLLAN